MSDKTVFFHDFKRDAFGQMQIEITGVGGENVEIAIGEVACNGRINRNPGGSRYFAVMSLTLKPGTHCYDFLIPEHVAPEPSLPKCLSPLQGEIAPFRYAEVIGCNSQPVFLRHEVFNDFDDNAADFHSSNPKLNRIWDFCKYSIKATLPFGKYIDGNRERLPYEGDAYINQLGHFCCDANFAIAKNTLEHFMIYPTWPTEWQLLTPIITRDYMLYSGDKKSVLQWLPTLKKRLLLDMAGNDCLIRETKNIRDIVDWPPTERDNYEFGDANFVPNAYHYASLLAMMQLSGDQSYGQRAEQVKASLRKIMRKDGIFVDSPTSKHTSMHTAFFAIVFGIAEPEDYPALSSIIRQRGMGCSVYGAQFLLEACYKCGIPDYALQLMTSTGLRSWQNMLDKGATITMEAWDDTFKPNQDWNHAWGAAPANIIPRGLCGIKPTSPGFTTFSLQPQIANLSQVYCRHPTMHGPIILEIENGKGCVTVPKGTEGNYQGKILSPGNNNINL